MRTKSSNSVGALHPILFFAVMYVVVLFLSIFICSSLFYSLNGPTSENVSISANKVEKNNFPVQVSAAAVVVR